MRKYVWGFSCVFLLLSGCATVPPLREDGIAIAEIVQRVKCEIAFAVPEPEPPWPTGRYQWMRNWTTKVDLTLKTDDQSSISPSATFITPLKSTTIPLVGMFSRSFAFGVGGGISGTANRTEVLSFTVSLRDLRAWKEHGDCNLPSGLDLYGNLGLREWITSALAPVELKQLRVGRHPPPGGKSPPAPPVVPEEEVKGFCDLNVLTRAKKAIEHYASIAESALENAARNGARDEIQSTYDEAAIVYGAVKEALLQVRQARKEAKERNADGSCSDADSQMSIKMLLADANKAGGRATAAKDSVDKIIDALPHDPPIDSISHSVNFVVALSGNVTPNWTLVHFKGIGASANLAAASYTETHTLALSMGSPAQMSTEQNRQLNNLVIIENLGQPKPSQ
jgi:hypothetical protein